MIRLALLLTLLSTAAVADQLHLREYRGRVCYDGDTCYVTMYGLPESLQAMSVRIRGIDTPERRGKCEREKALALRATAFANSAIAAAKRVEFRPAELRVLGIRRRILSTARLVSHATY